MFPSVFPEKWVKFSYHLGLLNISVINMLLPRMQASFGPYRWGKPRLGLGQSGQEPMCFSIIAASDRQGPRGSKWRKPESFIITLRSPLLPPQEHLLAVLEGREQCYFVFRQSALPQAPWEARSTFQWCPHEWGGVVEEVKVVRTANCATSIPSSLEERFRLTIPHDFE